MRKIITLILLFVVLLPSQVLAATSTSTVDKLFFESYKDQVKEVKDAQKKLNDILCTNVKALTEKSKTSTTKYNNAVKSKASKEVLAKAKAERDLDKKTLNSAKATCSTKAKELKKKSDSALKEIAAYKAKTVTSIKNHLDGKDKLTENDFSESVYQSLSEIESKFDAILESLSAD
ncbi:hypothetical protein [Paenibacillus antarcticus]|uniref:Uncharacterized protein n=1 Tax=Paenibacillus antarcticus TaxID=253703 RepID=A0A162MA73_9BACL|nr:hypothetical protein [Paenibacillus antarcticus]OAB40874.1 hypothetical protein PBAT_22395 [Paenibacillus antarcticus]OAB40933.1 hypothetical protein PBAT_22360 [Paenibacillus antarcticus]